MIIGRFGNTTGRPHLEGRVVIPRLKLSANVSFIVDTGADKTVLMPMDGIKMGLNYQNLVNTVDTVGIGGVAKDFIEPAVVVFLDDAGMLYIYSISLHISAPSPDIMMIP